MGLKLKRFKAKLNWKTKEIVPDVVCLRYQIHSEFDDPLQVPIPTTSSTQLGTNNVIKEKKPTVKPPVQGMFETNTSIPKTSTPTTPTPTNLIPNTSTSSDTNVNNNNHKPKTNGVLTTNQTTAAVTTEPVPTKGILKKFTPDEPAVTETKLNQNDAKDTEDNKKSALIFMTENHEDSEEPTEEKHTTKEENKHLDLETNSKLNSKTAKISHQEVETGEFQFNDVKETQQKSNLNTEENEEEETVMREKLDKSDSESEQADIKTVRWRETIMEINPPNLELDTQKSIESADDFKIHFVKHHNISTNGLQAAETEESESEENDPPQVKSYYGNRSAYSSQAASIFFAGEEPEPTPRVRNVSQGQDDDIDV